MAPSILGNVLNQDGMEHFEDSVSSNSLMDVNLRRARFTWSNRRKGNQLIQVRLDRFVISPEGLPIFGDYTLSALPKVGSNHSPLVLKFSEEKRIFNSPFRFESMWLDHPTIQDCISKGWSTDFPGTLMAQVAKKFIHLKVILKEWKRQAFGNASQRKKDLKDQLGRLDNKMQIGLFTEEDKRLERNLLVEYHNTLASKEKMWRQNSRALWLREGDRNTKYFHISILCHRSFNKIKELVNVDGSMTEDALEIRHEIISFL